MLLELHAHSSLHSKCSVISPVDLVRQVVRKGLQGIIFTEHHYLWTPEEIARLRREAGVEPYFLIMSGQEVDTDAGHVLVFGADRTIPERVPLDELRASFPEAAVVWAHPFRKGRRPPEELFTSPLLDGVEIFSLNQSMQENYRGLQAWHRRKFTATCGSDTHSSGMAGTYPTQFDHPVTDIHAVAAEIRRGRCRPFFKEIPKSGADMVVTEITIGTKGENEVRNRIIVRHIPDPGKWHKATESARLIETLREHGFRAGQLRVPRIVEIIEQERVLIEEGQRGKNLFDLLLSVHADTGSGYFRMAARWLARLHALRLRFDGAQDIPARERQRFASYERSFSASGNPRTEDARKLIAFVSGWEEDLFTLPAEEFVQLHGDYHPKNIIVGRDRMHDPATVFISVIDFNNSLSFCPAFDVGYFLAQFRSQFALHPEVLARYTNADFLDAYLEGSPADRKNFIRKVDLFQARAALSIASYLIRVGKGSSPELSDTLDHAMRILEKYA